MRYYQYSLNSNRNTQSQIIKRENFSNIEIKKMPKLKKNPKRLGRILK